MPDNDFIDKISARGRLIARVKTPRFWPSGDLPEKEARAAYEDHKGDSVFNHWYTEGLAWTFGTSNPRHLTDHSFGRDILYMKQREAERENPQPDV